MYVCLKVSVFLNRFAYTPAVSVVSALVVWRFEKDILFLVKNTVAERDNYKVCSPLVSHATLAEKSINTAHMIVVTVGDLKSCCTVVNLKLNVP